MNSTVTQSLRVHNREQNPVSLFSMLKTRIRHCLGIGSPQRVILSCPVVAMPGVRVDAREREASFQIHVKTTLAVIPNTAFRVVLILGHFSIIEAWQGITLRA